VALLNPPELRPSVQLLIVNDLANRRGQREKEERLVSALAPRGLGGAEPDRDVRRNLTAAIAIGVVNRDGEDIQLSPPMHAAAKRGRSEMISTLRQQVLDPIRNSGDWGSQAGARDLTNALSWFLSMAAGEGPIEMEGGGPRSAKELQERDFGPRQPDMGDDDTGGWPIGNLTRWQAFRRWACSLGFAWVTPKGSLVADPTAAIRDELRSVFVAGRRELSAAEFISQMAELLPVLDRGTYREFVEANWQRPADESNRLGEPLSDALERLRAAGRLEFDDRADAPRIARFDGSTFSHVRLGRS
jgi:hypothetical protein